MSFQLQLKLDLKKLYERLCDKCRKELIRTLKESIDDNLILKAIGVEEGGDKQ